MNSAQDWNAQDWIDALGLKPLPEEGGWYREVYRSDEAIPEAALPDRFGGPRCFATSIYYLLPGDEYSAFHRIRQEETWHFYTGSPLTLHVIDAEGAYRTITLGRDYASGEHLQTTIRRGDLFAATVDAPAYDAPDGFTLVGCTVAPGFEFADFEAPSRADLLAQYPEHESIIRRLTRAR